MICPSAPTPNELPLKGRYYFARQDDGAENQSGGSGFWAKLCCCFSSCFGPRTVQTPATYLGGGMTYLLRSHADDLGNQIAEFFGTQDQFRAMITGQVLASQNTLIGKTAEGYSVQVGTQPAAAARWNMRPATYSSRLFVQDLCNQILALQLLDRYVETEHVLCARGLLDEKGSTLATSGWMGFALQQCKGVPAIIVDVGSGQIKIFEWDGQRGKEMKIVDEVTEFYARLGTRPSKQGTRARWPVACIRPRRLAQLRLMAAVSPFGRAHKTCFPGLAAQRPATWKLPSRPWACS